MRFKLDNVRLAFPALFEAVTVNGEGKPAFSALLLMAPDHPGVKLIEAALVEVAKDKWGTKAEQTLKQLRAADKVCLHEGDRKAEYAGFEGQVYVSARNQVRPLVIDRDRSPLSASDGKPYPGCYVNAVLDLWAQDNAFGKRINAGLSGIQFVKDGEAFTGGGAAKQDEFDDLGEDLV